MKYRITIEEVSERESLPSPAFETIYQQTLDDVDMRRLVALVNMKEWYFSGIDQSGNFLEKEDMTS